MGGFCLGRKGAETVHSRRQRTCGRGSHRNCQGRRYVHSRDLPPLRLLHHDFTRLLRDSMRGRHARQEPRPPERDAQAAVNDALLEDEEDDEDEEEQAGHEQHAVEPVRFLEHSDELFGCVHNE